MPIYYTTAAGAQDGYAVGGLWAGGTAALIASNLHAIGLQFAIHTDFDAEGRPRDPALVYPSFDLTMNAATNLGSGTISISFVDEPDPAPYSTALAPGTRDEVALEDVVWTLGDTSFTVTLSTLEMVENLRSSAWNGIISLTLESTMPVLTSSTFHSAEGATATLAPSINTGTEVPFHTGFHEGPAFDRRARLRHCPRTGMPVASDEMTRDGYVEGMMVSPDGWDPIDPEDRYIPSPLEGVVDDEV